jgi:hypothetical protein
MEVVAGARIDGDEARVRRLIDRFDLPPTSPVAAALPASRREAWSTIGSGSAAWSPPAPAVGPTLALLRAATDGATCSGT